jgi:hypothetical protein
MSKRSRELPSRCAGKISNYVITYRKGNDYAVTMHDCMYMSVTCRLKQDRTATFIVDVTKIWTSDWYVYKNLLPKLHSAAFRVLISKLQVVRKSRHNTYPKLAAI